MKRNVSAFSLHTNLNHNYNLLLIIMKIILEAASSDSQVGSGDAIVSGNAQALKRSGSKDDKRINGQQASNKLQALRVTSSKKDIRRLQQSSHFLKQENVYDADSEDEDANDGEATLKAEVS